MASHFRIVIKTNAGTVNTTATGAVPDGEFVVEGVNDGVGNHYVLQVHNELGHILVQAQHYVPNPPPATAGDVTHAEEEPV